jgi:2'-5' RNA ligase|tara:strand:+ start:380 stop:931 length:552 start_codon:yes stop_codon:yes gene_type:complete
MKVIQKYFLAIVPTGEIQQAAAALKMELKAKLNIKYALKSPAHITLKMPFNYNEAKEKVLIETLENFLSTKKSLKIKVGGTDKFGKRVIFWKVQADSSLTELQTDLKTFCKRELNLVDELSDRNYHPHMTIAFKDVKERDFDEAKALIQKSDINQLLEVCSVELLKRLDGKWVVIQSLKMASD